MPKSSVWSKAMEYLGLDPRTAATPQTGVDLVEYRVTTVAADDGQLEVALNDLAAEGWALVQMLPLPREGSDGYEPLSGSVRLVMLRTTPA